MAKLSSLVDKAKQKQRENAAKSSAIVGTAENKARAAEVQASLNAMSTKPSASTIAQSQLTAVDSMWNRGSQSSGTTVPTVGERISNTIAGGLLGSGAGFTNTLGAITEGLGNIGDKLQDKKEKRQAEQELEYIALYKQQLEDARKSGDKTAEKNAQIRLNQAEYRLKNISNLGDMYTEVNEAAVQDVYERADELARKSQKKIEQAKQGTGAVGSALVDVGAAGTQLLGDIAMGAVTGTGAMAPIFIRGFGSGAQQARQQGATYEQQLAYGLGSATVEALTEKIASVGSVATKAFGKGALDDITKGVIRAVEGQAKTAAGKQAINRLASIGTGFVGEGIEEAVSAMIDPLLQKATYSDEKIDWEQAAHDAAYQFLIGGVLGGVMGGIGGTDTSTVDTRSVKADNKDTPATVSPAASPEVQQVQAQAEVTKAQNPEAEVLDAATTLFTQQGMNLKTAQTRAEIVGKLVRGEEVSDKDLNKIDPTSNQTKQIFTQLTGVQFPEGKIQIEALRSLYRSAHTVAQAAKAQVATVAENARVESPIPDEQILERAKEARAKTNPESDKKAAQMLAQARGEIAPDGTALPSYKDFAARYMELFPEASRQDAARAYDDFIRDNQTISFMGRRMTRQQVLKTLDTAPGVEQLSAEERAQIEADLNEKFDRELEAQKRDGKDATEHSERRRRTEVREKVQRSVNDWKKVLTENSSVKDIVLDESMAENENAFITSDGVVHLNANRMTSEADVAYVLGHELVHSVKDTDARKAMVNDIIETVRKITEPSESRENAIERYRKMYQEHENQVAARANREAQTISFEYAEEEYAADLMREVFLSGDMLNKLADEKPSLMARIQEILQKWIASLKGNNEAVELYNELTALQDRFVQALRSDAAQQRLALENAGIQVDTETESARRDRFSLDTWLESDYMTDPENAAKALAKAIGVSDKKAAKYIKDVNGVAKLIADDKTLLDYEAAPGVSSFVSNTEYGGSVDFSTICKKRRLFTGTFTAIQKALPNTALTSDEMIDIRKRMKDAGHEVSCGLCYVEGSRLNLGQYATEFLDKYTAEDHEFVPAIADLTTVDGQEELRREHPEVYEAYISYLNTLAQRKPKVYQTATAYNGEILKKFGKDAKVEEKNKNGGLRLQSFSDFEIIHLIDNMQVIMDMARVGLAGQAYTKVPDFAWAMGNTGLKINLSLIAKDVDADGHLVFDDVEGMPHEEAKKLRDAYSDNVGTIIVVFNDAQLKAAMADDFIDYIIPFHRSQLNKTQYDGLGLPKGAKDYTTVQNESYIEPVLNKNGKKTRPENYMPNKYWDFNKSGKENAESYLKMCAENNRRPKFSNVLEYNGDGSYSLPADGSADGYWKLLIDFKMYNNDGVGVPQQPVKPDFNLDEANRMLSEYKGGHSNFPVAQDIVDEFVADYKKNHPDARYSVGYWKPNLDSAEWDIVKSVMSNGRGTNLTAIDKMFFESTKGKSVFGIYSTDDDALLYASRGEDAVREHQFVTLAAEEYDNGGLTDTSAEGLRAWGEAVRVQLDAISDNAGDAVASGRLGGDAEVYGEQPRLYASEALRNVLENIFKTEESRRANSVTEQHTQASEKSDASSLPKYSITPQFEEWYLQGFENADERTRVQESLARLRQQYGDIPAGETPTRAVQMPRKNEQGERVHDTVQTVMEAEATPENRLGDIQKAVVDGKFADIPIENKITARRMREKIKRDGWDTALTNWTAKVRAGESSADLVAEGAILLNNAGNSDMSGEQYVDLLTDYSDLLHRTGQALQAARILKRLSPEGKLYGIQAQVRKLNDARQAKAANKKNFDPVEWAEKSEIKLDPSLVEAYRNAENDVERDLILEQIQQNIADQIPATLPEKLNTWRYLAMLGNFRTQIRNVFGNAAFQIPRAIKETVAGGIEGALSKFGVPIERTRSTTADTASFKAAWSDFESVRDIILTGSKLDEKTLYANAIDSKRRIYKNAVLEGYRRVVNTAMDEGDAVFCRYTYADALARFMAANGTTWDQASEVLRERGRRVAIKEAAEATYRDSNAFSNMILKARFKNPKNMLEKGVNAVIEGILPFKKTPANILVRGIEYSPLGLIRTAVDSTRLAKGDENVSGSDIINDIAKTITGSGLFALGYFMVKNGLLAALGPDDEDEHDFWELQGHQSYALEWNGKSYTIDWLAPEALPLLAGANTAEVALDEGLDMNAVVTAVTRITDPMLSMSMLQGVNDLLENIANTKTVAALPTLVANSLWSYGLQYVPTLLGQAERAADNTRRTTYVDKTSGTPTGVQYAAGKLSQKVPGWDYQQIPYIDQWGRMEQNYETELGNAFGQFLNPSYTSLIDTSKMESEIQRVFDQTGDSGVLPKSAPKYFTVDGERRDLAADEYVDYATTRGQLSYQMLTDMIESDFYKNLDDAHKAEAISSALSYAGEVAKADVLETDLPKSATKVQTSDEYGISAAEYVALDAAIAGIESLKDADGETIENSKGLLIMEAVYAAAPNLTKQQYKKLFEDLGVGKTIRGYSEKKVAKELAAMRD